MIMNRVMLIGNVGMDPEVRYFEADNCVARVRLATTEKGYVLQNGTRVPDRTDWHNLVFSRKLAKVVEQYVHKGDKLYVDGRLQYSRYDDKRGIQRTLTEIIVDSMEMLTPRANAAQSTVGQSSATSVAPSAQPAIPLASSAQPAADQSHTPQQPATDPGNEILPF